MFKLTVLIAHKEAEFFFRTKRIAEDLVLLSGFKAYTIEEVGQE